MDGKIVHTGITKQQSHSDLIAQSPTVLKAKARLIEALKEQLKAAEAMVAGEPYMITKMKWQTNDDTGERVRVPIQVPLRKWYWRDAEGQVRFSLRVRNKKLELKKGKTDIVVGGDRQLPAVIQSCIATVETGDLDNELAKHSGRSDQANMATVTARRNPHLRTTKKQA